MDKDGNNATYYDPDENAKHTPGTILHKANYTSCGGGYKENFYYCMDCGAAIDGNGNPINPCDPENSIHTPSTEVYPADYTICNGGYKTEYHKCIYCGSAVNAEGKYATWYGGSYYDHIKGTELHPADYTLCGGGRLWIITNARFVVRS